MLQVPGSNSCTPCVPQELLLYGTVSVRVLHSIVECSSVRFAWDFAVRSNSVLYGTSRSSGSNSSSVALAQHSAAWYSTVQY
jgi:hypothetical protein